MCPVNTHRVYKMGSNVRVDSNVAGAENEPLQEGVSVIFQGKGETSQYLHNLIFYYHP